MSNEWNIDYIKKIAGISQVNEAFDDDDEDPDVKTAMSDKRQAAFEKRNKNELTRAEREAAMKERMAKEKAKEAREKKADEKPAEKKEEPKADEKPAPKAEEKTEDNSNEAKRRGRAPSDDSKRGQARSWLNSHPNSSRKEFLAHASSFGMSPAYASAFRAAHMAKSKVTECYVLSHPSMPSFLLAENREMSQMQWVDPTSPLEPMIFESKAEAERVAKYMSEWKSQYSNIDVIKLVD